MAIKKGLYFSMDGLIAFAILMIGIFAVPMMQGGQDITDDLYFAAKDFIQSLSELKISETNNSYVKELINDSTITDLNKTILEQIGFFWSENQTELAMNLTKAFAENLISSNKGFGFYINNESVYERAVGSINTIATSKKLVSGIAPNKSIEGYISRAIISKASKNVTKSYPFFVQGSAQQGGNGMTVTKKFSLNSSDIIKAKFYISIHYGTSNINSMKFKVNGNDIVINWTYLEERTYDGKTTHVAFGVGDATNRIQNGTNVIEVFLMTQSSVHAMINPGMRLDITFETSEVYSSSNKKRIYLDNIESRETGGKKCGVWSIAPLYVKKGRTVKNATLHVKALNVDNVTSIPAEAPQYNAQIYINEEALDLFNPSGTVDKTYDITNNITEGNNVIGVYFNAYEDIAWGIEDTILYSDPVSDPSGSSYVEIEYESSDPGLEYGTIDISIVDEFGGTKNNSKVFAKNITNPIIESFIHLAQLDSSNLSVWVNNSLATNKIFQTPREFATPSLIFADPVYLDTEGMNYFNLTDVCVDCHVLPESAFEYILKVPSQVGYGDVFSTKEEAEEDALQRLNDLMAGVNITDIEDYVSVSSGAVGNVPSLWGPAIMEVRLWQ